MTTIYLVRHGRTDLTGKQLIGSLPGVHLNDIGFAQAQRIADWLRKYSLSALFSSPFERAQDTATPIASQTGLSITTVDFLREIEFGDLKGLGEELISQPVWREFYVHPAHTQFPSGESVVEAQIRVINGLNGLASNFNEQDQIVCVSHCEILRLAISHALHMPLDEYMRLTIDPGSISCVKWDKDQQMIKFLNFIPY